MARFTNILVAYLCIGAVMWGGGVLVFQDSGIATLIVEDVSASGANINENTSSNLQESGGPIQEAAGAVGGGGLLAVWNVLVKFIGYLFWPIISLQAVGAPPRVVVMLGGPPVVAFLGSVLRLIRASA